MKWITVIFVLLYISFPVHSQVGEDDALLDSYIIEEMASGGFVGMAASVISGNELVWSRGYGYANLEKKIPFTPQTLINIASISKTITATSLMVLVEKNYIALDFYANEIIPFDLPKNMSLRNLATHTSGIHDRDEFYDVEAYIYEGTERPALGEFLIEYLSKGGKDYKNSNYQEAELGQRYEYSNIGAGLAGYVVESASGKGLDQFSRQYIFEPLGMSSTGWFMKDIDRNLHSLLYKKGGSSVIPFYELATYPDGNVRTSVEELAAFLGCIANGGEYKGTRILKEQTVAEMLSPQFPTGELPIGFEHTDRNLGIFWELRTNENGENLFGHSGGDPGVITMMYYNRDLKKGVILFTNTEGSFDSLSEIYKKLWEYARTIE